MKDRDDLIARLQTAARSFEKNAAVGALSPSVDSYTYTAQLLRDAAAALTRAEAEVATAQAALRNVANPALARFCWCDASHDVLGYGHQAKCQAAGLAVDCRVAVGAVAR